MHSCKINVFSMFIPVGMPDLSVTSTARERDSANRDDESLPDLSQQERTQGDIDLELSAETISAIASESPLSAGQLHGTPHEGANVSDRTRRYFKTKEYIEGTDKSHDYAILEVTLDNMTRNQVNRFVFNCPYFFVIKGTQGCSNFYSVSKRSSRTLSDCLSWPYH